MHAAQVLCDSIKENDLVYILVGFVLLPHKVPEMDGTVSAMLLARALVMAFNAKPIIVCPADSVQAIEKCAAVVGLHIYEDLDTVQELPLSMGVVAFTKTRPPPRRRPKRWPPASLPPSSRWRPAARTRWAFTTTPSARM